MALIILKAARDSVMIPWIRIVCDSRFPLLCTGPYHHTLVISTILSECYPEILDSIG